jgi:hypothetical protein
MKMNFYDKIAILLYIEIGGFVSLFYLVSEIVPSYSGWKFPLATFLFSVSLSYLSIRLILSIIKEMVKDEKQNK